MSEPKKGFLQRLFGGTNRPEPAEPTPRPQKEPPSPEPKREPPDEDPAVKDPRREPAQKEPPSEKDPPMKVRAATKSPPPSGPHESDAPSAPGKTSPPPGGPAKEPGAPSPEERAPSKREKNGPEPAEEEGPASPKPSRDVGKKKPGQPGERDRTPEIKEPRGPMAPAERNEVAKPERRSWFAQLRQGLARSSSALGDSLSSVVTKRRLDEDTLDDIEAVLIKADLGPAVAGRIRSTIAKGRYERGISQDELRELLAAEVARVLRPHAQALELRKDAKPHVVLVVGVNGTGKTTTIGKLAHRLMESGSSVLLAAGDTFRAAAIDQLKIWGGRIGAEVVAHKVGADPAGLAYEALERATAENKDVLLIDTAGRLQNKSDLMAELAKIVRVLKKLDASAPHSVILVLDATTGQNALNQVQIFQEIAGVSGLVVTKLDGTARGGILVAIAERFALPIIAIGVGEGLDDLEPFDADDFARAIAGYESENAAAA